LTESFHSYAESRDVGLHFLSEPEKLVMDYDPDKTLNIVSNLLSNAIKFTPQRGEVYLQVGKIEEGFVPIQLRDTGVGISEDKLPYIFDRFYQADDSATRHGEGTGIGLALTKELVKLLGGEIEVESAVGEGSTFTVLLPIKNTAPLLETTPTFKLEAFATNAVVSETFNKVNSALPLALIVEDNADVVTYLVTCLQNQYQIEVAYNGQEGIDKAIEIIPDIIISDVMMPKKDGFELCRTLKNDIRTSHIPIILLTARADVDSRLEGLEGGADAYLTKPFKEQELEISLRKSLELRQRLRQRYAQAPFIPPLPNKNFAKDDTFFNALHELVVKEYENDKFSIEVMAKTLGLSHAQLGRKVKALLNMPPKQYLQKYRLSKARHLIQHTNLLIQDIAYQTGFGSPEHFSNEFYKEFQQRPSDLR